MKEINIIIRITHDNKFGTMIKRKGFSSELDSILSLVAILENIKQVELKKLNNASVTTEK